MRGFLYAESVIIAREALDLTRNLAPVGATGCEGDEPLPDETVALLCDAKGRTGREIGRTVASPFQRNPLISLLTRKDFYV